jgi:hypothetical protein
LEKAARAAAAAPAAVVAVGRAATAAPGDDQVFDVNTEVDGVVTAPQSETP